MVTPLRRCRFLLPTLFIVLSGCGGGRAAVEGSVTLDGVPVEAGYITFVPIEETAGSGARAKIEKGHYVIDPAGRPVPGVYRVEISARRKTGKKIPIGSPAPLGTMADEEVEAVPARYNKESKVRRELKAGPNTADFSPTSQGS